MEKVKILVVEDQSIIAKDIQMRLNGMGYDVPVIAFSGEEAVKMTEEIQPDLVLMDIVIPLMDGIEVTREILKIDSGAKVLAQTAYASTKGKEILEAGALDVIEKPFDLKKLQDTIKKYLK